MKSYLEEKGCTTEELVEMVQKLLKERGEKPLQLAKKVILKEKIECKEAREALKYFMTKYWHDLARPTLLSVCCEAVGGKPDATVPFAVPLILIGGAIDIHDDIIDESKTKMSHPTIYGIYGKEIALIVGDALLFKGFTLLHKACKNIPAKKATAILNIVKRMFFEVGDAQASELKLRKQIDIVPEVYLRILEKKMADVEALARIGAILGGGSKREIEDIGKYGRFLGITIGVRDDIIDMLNLNEALHRFRKETLPLPVFYASQNPKIREKLETLLAKKLKKKDFQTVLEIIENGDAIEQSQKIMHEMGEKALSHLKGLKKPRLLRLFIYGAFHPFLPE